MNTNLVLLHGAATPLGEQLLLKLAVAGFEVTAQVPPAPWRGRTDEYAAHVTTESLASAVAEDCGGALIVVAAAPMPIAEVEATLRHGDRIQHWMQCAERASAAAPITAAVTAAGISVTTVVHDTLFADLKTLAEGMLRRPLPIAAWRAGRSRSIRAVDEADVATVAVAAMSRQRPSVRVDGTTLPLIAALHAVASQGGHRPWWLPLLRNPHPAIPALRFRSPITSLPTP